jgi:hypothetical protein
VKLKYNIRINRIKLGNVKNEQNSSIFNDYHLAIVFSSGCTVYTNETKNTYNGLKITDPANNSTVSQVCALQGYLQPLAPGEKFYILVKPGHYTWWVQKEPTIFPDGKWAVYSLIGEKNDDNMNFTVAAITTNQTLKPGTELGPDLPEYNLKDEIMVKR